MNIGLFFGTFNPVHNGHIQIALSILKSHSIENVWFILSPQSPLKMNHIILDKNIRYDLLKKTTDKYNRLCVSKIEFDLSTPNYTYITLMKLKEKFPKYEFALIMGEDNYFNLNKWKKIDYIKKNFEIIVYPRGKNKNKEVSNNNELIPISSSQIRSMIKNGKDINGLIPSCIEKEIVENKYYSK